MDDVTSHVRQPHFWLAAALVTLVAAALRFYRLDENSLTVDEATMVMWAQSILDRGYPVLPGGTTEVQLATYELYSYILAVFVGIFGTSDFAVRLAPVVLGIGTTYVIFSSSCNWFNLRTGLLAGLLYATMPWAIFWSQDAFHPQSHQFFAALTLVYAERVFQGPAIQARNYYLAALYFSCGFLCWEGLGFMLPILLIVALVLRWGDWKWLHNRHLWAACAIVIAVIVVQGTRRILLLDNYLLVGSGRSEIAGPEAAFLQPYYSPYFYADQIFGGYAVFVLSIVFWLGLIFVRRSLIFRFLAIFVVAAVLVMGNLLSYYTLHYIYFALPAFVIVVAAATVFFVDWLAVRATGLMFRSRRQASAAVLLALAALEVGTAGAYGLKTYAITESAKAPPPTAYGTRVGTEFVDYKGLGAIFNEYYPKGDPVLVETAYALGKYTGQYGSYFMQSWTFSKMLFDPGGDRVRYIDKTSTPGSPVVRNQRELDDVLARNGSMWFVIQPAEVFTAAMDPSVLSYFQERAKLKAATFNGALYKWPR
ncbi:MAG TPA: glycosyltransferase family 39 protein [Burkholderiales bacterium]|jgi:4-amino-4-deoxy-L-arabinose transferase-like glycosyltransferase|nr:glycosyltransferase family 39 protein [Burkholderiales bacterium]